MKDLATALEEEVQITGTQKNGISELILDDKCRTTQFTGLEEFTSLTRLSLCNVGLTSLAGFPPLAHLSRLNLADNRILDGLEYLTQTGLPNLRVLSLAHNRISDISQLEPLKQLELTSLDLCECPLTQNVDNYRGVVLEMLPSLRILDKIDREGIELLDDEEDDDEEDDDDEDDEDNEEDDDEDDDEDSSEDYEEMSVGGTNEGDERMETEPYNLVTSSEDDEQSSHEEEEEPEEIHVSVLAGPPISDGKSDDDQDYTAPDVDSESEDYSFDSDDDISVSHHFSTGEGQSAGVGPSQPSAPIGGKRKRTPEDRAEDLPKDEDYEDL